MRKVEGREREVGTTKGRKECEVEWEKWREGKRGGAGGGE